MCLPFRKRENDLLYGTRASPLIVHHLASASYTRLCQCPEGILIDLRFNRQRAVHLLQKRPGKCNHFRFPGLKRPARALLAAAFATFVLIFFGHWLTFPMDDHGSSS